MEPCRTAVILAAGIGRRLHSVLADRPKGFLELGGTPIVKRSLIQLRDSGITKIVIVTGFKAEYYRSLALDHPQVQLIHNPEYADSGSMYSLYCARKELSCPYILLESDIIYDTCGLTTLTTSPKPNGILASDLTFAGDEVYIDATDEQIVNLTKNKTGIRNLAGELVGISKISSELHAAMIAHAASYFRTSLRLDYESCISAVTRRVSVYLCHARALLWAEIDTPSHWQRAKGIYSQLLEKDL